MKTLLRSTVLAAAALFVITGFAVNEASGQDIINTVLTRMNNHNKSLKSLKANVTMVKVNEQIGGVTDTSEGTVSYLPSAKKNPYIRLDWKKPQESMAVIDKTYVLYRPGANQAYIGKIDKVTSKGGQTGPASALAFMNMTRAELRARYDLVYLGEVTIKGGVKTWHLKMTPKARESYKDAEIWVDTNGMPVQSKVTEHNGDSTTIHLSDLKKNVTINASEFKIDPPKGTNIIRS